MRKFLPTLAFAAALVTGCGETEKPQPKAPSNPNLKEPPPPGKPGGGGATGPKSGGPGAQ